VGADVAALRPFGVRGMAADAQADGVGPQGGVAGADGVLAVGHGPGVAEAAGLPGDAAVLDLGGVGVVAALRLVGARVAPAAKGQQIPAATAKEQGVVRRAWGTGVAAGMGLVAGGAGDLVAGRGPVGRARHGPEPPADGVGLGPGLLAVVAAKTDTLDGFDRNGPGLLAVHFMARCAVALRPVRIHGGRDARGLGGGRARGDRLSGGGRNGPRPEDGSESAGEQPCVPLLCEQCFRENASPDSSHCRHGSGTHWGPPRWISGHRPPPRGNG